MQSRGDGRERRHGAESHHCAELVGSGAHKVAVETEHLAGVARVPENGTGQDRDELGVLALISPGEGGIKARVEHSPERVMELRPIARDTDQFSRVVLRFRRDGAGRVTLIDCSDPVLRNIKFTRLKDS